MKTVLLLIYSLLFLSSCAGMSRPVTWTHMTPIGPDIYKLEVVQLHDPLAKILSLEELKNEGIYNAQSECNSIGKSFMSASSGKADGMVYKFMFRCLDENEAPIKEMKPSEIYNLGYHAKDDEEVIFIYWLSLAAEKGNSDAQKTLGGMYEEGRRVPQNYDEAIKWYTLAAHQGDINAQRKLGLCYIESNEDYISAYAWLTIAAGQGSNLSKKKRDEITYRMTPEQISAANELIKEIKGEWK